MTTADAVRIFNKHVLSAFHLFRIANFVKVVLEK